MSPLGRAIDILVFEQNRYRKALQAIANLNNGPDQASGEYRAKEAVDIAQRALAMIDKSGEVV